MRVIILAAGRGQRLSPLTDQKHKCMIPLGRHPLIHYQLKVFQQMGLNDIHFVTGYKHKQIEALNYPCFHNENWETTNMLFSLMMANQLFDGQDEILVVYGDIIFETHVVGRLLADENKIATIIDKNWYQLWQMRSQNPLEDAETLKLSRDRKILEIGKKPTSLKDIQGQYMGMIRIRRDYQYHIKWHFENLLRFYPDQTEKMHLTGFLQSLIESGEHVQAVISHGGWLELDTFSDWKLYNKLFSEGRLSDWVELP